MEEVNGYNITQKEFNKLKQVAENIYNTLVVVDYFLDYSDRSVLHSTTKNLSIFIRFIELSLLRVSQLCCSLYRKSAFCINQPEIQELYNLTPIIKNLHKDADLMNAFFINFENSD